MTEPLTITCEICNAIHAPSDAHFCAMAAITANVRSLRAKAAEAEKDRERLVEQIRRMERYELDRDA